MTLKQCFDIKVSRLLLAVGVSVHISHIIHLCNEGFIGTTKQGVSLDTKSTLQNLRQMIND